MNMPDINGFAQAQLGDSVLENPYIPDPGGSKGGIIVMSILPGIKEMTLPNGEKIVTDDLGNVIK